MKRAIITQGEFGRCVSVALHPAFGMKLAVISQVEFGGGASDSLRAAFRGVRQAKYTFIRANFMAATGCAARFKENHVEEKCAPLLK
jgi:hypothetical protein